MVIGKGLEWIRTEIPMNGTCKNDEVKVEMATNVDIAV